MHHQPPVNPAYVGHHTHVHGDPDGERKHCFWKRNAIIVGFIGVAMVALGAHAITLRNQGQFGGCCLPRGCDARLLQRTPEQLSRITSQALCQFTSDDFAVMNCPAAAVAAVFGPNATCRLADASGNCYKGGNGAFVGAGVPLIAVGALLVMVAATFVWFAEDCFGLRNPNMTCGNVCAVVGSSFCWATVFGGFIVALVFSSILLNKMRKVMTQDRAAWCSTAEHSSDNAGTTPAPSEQQQRCTESWQTYWQGAMCPLAAEPADKFEWLVPTQSQQGQSVGCLVVSIAGLLALCWIIARMTIGCCRKCNTREEYHCPGCRCHTAEGVAAVPLQPTVVNQGPPPAVAYVHGYGYGGVDGSAMPSPGGMEQPVMGHVATPPPKAAVKAV